MFVCSLCKFCLYVLSKEEIKKEEEEEEEEEECNSIKGNLISYASELKLTARCKFHKCLLTGK